MNQTSLKEIETYYFKTINLLLPPPPAEKKKGRKNIKFTRGIKGSQSIRDPKQLSTKKKNSNLGNFGEIN